MVERFLGYYSSLRSFLSLRESVWFLWGYGVARFSNGRSSKLHKIHIGRYIFYFPTTDFFGWLFIEIFFEHSYYIEKTLKPIRVIDAGANIGVSLLYIKFMAPNAEVLCFEPNPAARAVLEKNIEANGWETSVQVSPFALGSEDGTATFYVGTATDSSGGLASLGRKGSYSVSVKKLSAFVHEEINLLKLDIEGGEFAVLDDLIAANKLHYINRIQLEYHYEPGVFMRPLSDILVILETQGFKTVLQTMTKLGAMIHKDAKHTYMVYAWREGK